MLSKQIDWHCVHTDRTNLQLFRLGNICDTRNPNPMLMFSIKIKQVMDFYLNSKPSTAFMIAMVPVSFDANIQIESKKVLKKLHRNNISYVFGKSQTFVKIYFVSYSHCRYESNNEDITAKAVKIRIQIAKGNKKNQKLDSR